MDWDDNMIASAAQNLGVPPDYVREQLVAEGHTIAPSVANVGGMQAAPAGWMPPDQGAAPVNLGTMQAAPEGWMAPEAAPPAAQTQSAPGQWMVNQSNLQMPPPPAQAAPGTQVPRPGIRATGMGAAPQAQPGPGVGGAGGGGGGMSRVRKMFDERGRALESEVQGAYGQVQQGQARLGELQNEAFGFEQERLGVEAGAAKQRANVYSQYEQQALEAQKAEEVARQKEATVLAAKEQQHSALVDDYVNTRVRDRPSSTRVASAFGLAFAGIADALNQGLGNRTQFLASTMQIVDQAIDRDVNEQLEAIGRKKGAVDDSERSLSRLRSGIGDERAFRAATRAAHYEQMAARVNTIAQQTTSETARLTAEAALPEFQLRAQMARQESAQLAAADAQKRLRDLGEDQLGFEGKAALIAQSKAGTGPKPEKPLSTSVALQPVGTPSEADVAKSKEIASGSAGIMANIDALTEMAKKGATLSPDQRQIAKRRILALKSQYNGVFGDGTAPNEAQLEELSDVFSNPTEMNIGNAQRQFESFKQDAVVQTNAKLRFYNHQLGVDDFEPE